jgi:predicted transcriptional regulator
MMYQSVTTRMNKDIIRDIDAYAERRGMSRSAALRFAVDAGVKNLLAWEDSTPAVPDLSCISTHCSEHVETQ